VLCSSYSGDTEETLACYEAAGLLGAKRVVCTAGGELADLARRESVPVIPVAGGFQPRAAVAYATVAALEVAAASGAGPRMGSEIDVAAEHLEALVEEWGPDAPEDSLAKSVARRLHGSIPLIAGAGLTTPIAYRWKTQINQNAKLHAFIHELPELNHNELAGWGETEGVGPFTQIFLDDADTHPRVQTRISVTSELIADAAHDVLRIESRGRTTAERVLSLVLLGDLVSLYLAVLRRVDPTPLAITDQLKSRLAQAG